MSTQLKLTERFPPKQARFLKAYALLGEVAAAARAAGMDRSRHYQIVKKNTAYQAAFEDATEQYTDSLKKEVHRRAIEGYLRPRIYNGKLVMVPDFDRETGEILLDENGESTMRVYLERVYSDKLLLAMLRANCPEYSEVGSIKYEALSGPPARIEAEQQRDGPVARIEVRQDPADIMEIPAA